MTKNFIQIGYSKAGSTLLQKWFRENPNMIFSKGLHGIKDLEELSKFASGQKEFSEKVFVTSNHVFSLEHWDFSKSADDWFKSSNLKLYQARMANLLKHLMPDAKVFFITRGFDSVLKSFYSEYVKTGGVLKPEEMYESYGNYFLKDLYNYNFLISKYEALFGQENVLAIPFELLQNDSNQFFSVLSNFFGITESAFPDKKIKQALPSSKLFWTLVLNQFVKKISSGLGSSIYPKYSKQLLFGKFDFILNNLMKISKKELTIQLPIETIKEINSNSAKVLIKYPEYKNYYSHYFIDLD